MASAEKQELEYESDPEESKLSLTMMRRREASDDEDEDEDSVDERVIMPLRRVDSRAFDCESEDEGAAAEYDDDEDIEEENVYVEERVNVSDVKVVALELDEVSRINRVEEGEKENADGVYLQEDDQFGDNVVDERVEGEVQGEKKENEPFAVPTAGAFYMHDDRFRDSRAGGRHSRTFGGRSLWELKDDRRWGHDKFEEVTMRERNYDEGRRGSRGRNRGRGRSRGEERAYPRVNRTKALNNKKQNNVPNNYNTINNQNNALDVQRDAVRYQNNTPKSERGRGPRRYQPTWKKNEAPTEYKQRGKSSERSSHVNSGRTSEHTLSADNDSVPAMKHVFSSLNSASPPFYPSASSNIEISFGKKIDEQSAPLRQNPRSSIGDKSFSVSQSNTMQGKNVADLVGLNKLYIDDSCSYSKKSLTNSQLQDFGSSINLSQSLQSRVQGRDQACMGQMSYQPDAPHNQIKGASTSFQLNNVQRIPVQTRGQVALQASGQQFGPHPGSGNQTSCSLEPEEIDSLLESTKSRTALVGKGKGNIQGHGRGSFPYGGSQVMGASGNIGSAPGDQNFPATPTFLPVMQFGGQHPGGMGVPAVGMAFPGYVGNPGSGKSEMTWLPVLAGAAGAMGASYCNPYLSVDGAYHSRPSGQTPPMTAASRENNMHKPGNELKPSQRPQLANDEFGQRQNKARRYTEMKFDQ